MVATTQKIDLVTKYLPLLDEVYKVSARSSELEASPTLVRQTEEANVVKINKCDFDGLGNYSKKDGFPQGAITSEWETWTFSNDRGRKFNLDKVDNMENLGMAFLDITGQYLRTKVIPEKDAYTFAKIAGTAGVQPKEETLTVATVKTAIDDALAKLGEAEVDEGNMIMFVTPTVKGYLESAIGRKLDSGVGTYNQKISSYNDIPLISVPQTRFYSKIKLQDGTTNGQEKGGYIIDADSGSNVNFIIMDRNAAVTITKNAVTKIITPEENQLYDGWTFNYRFYYDTFVYENKVNGIYVSKQAYEG